MIHYLLLLQFGFLYCVTVIIGLGVFGSDFDTIANKLYFIPLLFIPLTQRWLNRAIMLRLSALLNSLILVLGVIIGLVVYRQLHFAYWDEHNAVQAILVSILGILSYLGALGAITRIVQWRGNHRLAVVAAFVVIAGVWLVAFIYPMFPLFGVVIIMALALLWPPSAESVNTTAQTQAQAAKAQSLQTEIATLGITQTQYWLFIIMLDLSLVIWDYQVVNDWALHLASALLVASGGYYVTARWSQFTVPAILVLVVLNLIAGVVWPLWLVQLPHAMIAGLGAGCTSYFLITAEQISNPKTQMMAWINPIIWAMLLAFLFYANLDFLAARLALLLPLLYFVYRYLNIKRENVGKSTN